MIALKEGADFFNKIQSGGVNFRRIGVIRFRHEGPDCPDSRDSQCLCKKYGGHQKIPALAKRATTSASASCRMYHVGTIARNLRWLVRDVSFIIYDRICRI